MTEQSGSIEKINARLQVHWIWAAGLALVALLILGNLIYSLIEDSGGSAHVQKVGLLTALAQTMADKLMQGLQHKAPPPEVTRASITGTLIQFFIFVVAVMAARGRLEAISRLKMLREELELRG